MAKKTTKGKAAGKLKPTRNTKKKAAATKKAKTKKAPRPRSGKIAKTTAARKTRATKLPAPVRRGATIEPTTTVARIEGLESALASCLDQEVATAVVFSCTGVGPVNPSVKLGQLFPGPTQRQGFCGCVVSRARDAGAAIAALPCTPSTTIAQVIDRLSC